MLDISREILKEDENSLATTKTINLIIKKNWFAGFCFFF